MPFKEMALYLQLKSLMVICVVIIVLSFAQVIIKPFFIFIKAYTLPDKLLYVRIMKFVQRFYHPHFIWAAQTNDLHNLSSLFSI